jgi:hypothetical protein
MATITLRVPDEKAKRLRALAKHRGVSVNKLLDEFSTQGLVEFDAENRFRALAARGSTREGIKLLDELDTAFANGGK